MTNFPNPTPFRLPLIYYAHYVQSNDIINHIEKEPQNEIGKY